MEVGQVEAGQARGGDGVVELGVQPDEEPFAGLGLVLGEDEAAAAGLVGDETGRGEVVVGAGGGDEGDLEVPREPAQRGQRGPGGQVAGPDGLTDLVDDLLVHGRPGRPGEDDVEVIMLTGDNAKTADAIGKELGISRAIADVLPADKDGEVSRLQKEGKIVMMVGDGINDAPAITRADIGVAVGAGTDVALESADIVLIKNDMKDIPMAIKLSRAVIRNIKQNLFWAFFYNCLGIPLAAGALYPAFGIVLSPMIGAAAMSMSSVFVVTNALRLRKLNL